MTSQAPGLLPWQFEFVHKLICAFCLLTAGNQLFSLNSLDVRDYVDMFKNKNRYCFRSYFKRVFSMWVVWVFGTFQMIHTRLDAIRSRGRPQSIFFFQSWRLQSDVDSYVIERNVYESFHLLKKTHRDTYILFDHQFPNFLAKMQHSVFSFPWNNFRCYWYQYSA